MSNDADRFFDLQLQALNDPRLTDDDKLFFCSLICEEGLRAGWYMGKVSWVGGKIESMNRLYDRGYVDLAPNLPAEASAQAGRCVGLMPSFLLSAQTSRATSGDIDRLFELQRQALDDPRLTDADKLLFCRLLCEAGLRHGWLYGRANWPDAEIEAIRRLHESAYVTCERNRKDGVLSVALECAPTESCPVCGLRTRATDMVSLSRTVRMCLACHDESDDRDQT